jgi:hypothetical protein
LQTKHRIALNRSFINEPYDALRAVNRPGFVGGHLV